MRRASIPPQVAALAGVVAVTGTAAGFAAAPILLLTSPVVAGGLAVAAAMLRRTPVWDPPPASEPVLPPDAQRAAVSALATLQRGVARGLLLDLLRRARAVSSPEDAARCGGLVVAACAAARDLAAIEQHLAAFDAKRDRLADPPPGWLDALTRCERGRDLLTQRLLEASATLSGWQARATLSEGADMLGALTRDLDEEGRRQAEAAREVAALLS